MLPGPAASTRYSGSSLTTPAARCGRAATWSGPARPGGPVGPSAIHAFDLSTGAPKASYALPEGSFCNDSAVGPNGDLYVSDTTANQILRLPRGGAALQVWSPAGAFGEGAGVDGVAVLDGHVYVGTLSTSKLFAVQIRADGTAGAVSEPRLSSPLTTPDGIRSWGDGLLSTDGTGKIQHIVFNGDPATVTAVKDGLDGVVAVTVVGDHRLCAGRAAGHHDGAAGHKAPAEKPYRAVVFTLP